ncbi:MAG: S-isoprenylcysteine methyltransferase [Denitrovibrio sp.]|nr:MAG: S-isoprenylcysteine methyltransferase [Denitrovibrio sp.]
MFNFTLSLTIYCVIHSILADSKIMGRVYYSWWYRFFYVVQSVVLLLPVLYFYHTMPSEIFFKPNLPQKNFLNIIFVSAITFGLYAVRSYDNASFLGLTQVKAKLNGEEYTYEKPTLTKKGALAVVRHPYYTASLVAIWARPLAVKDLYLNILLTLYFLLGTINEERKLKKEFGQEYLDYMKEVPALVPFFKLRR